MQNIDFHIQKLDLAFGIYSFCIFPHLRLRVFYWNKVHRKKHNSLLWGIWSLPVLQESNEAFEPNPANNLDVPMHMKSLTEINRADKTQNYRNKCCGTGTWSIVHLLFPKRWHEVYHLFHLHIVWNGAQGSIHPKKKNDSTNKMSFLRYIF